MTERKLICVACPRGCPITVTMDDNGEITKVEGNTCPRGKTAVLSTPDSPVKVILFPTDEEYMIAQDTYRLITKK